MSTSFLLAVLRPRVNDASWQWLEQAIGAIAGAPLNDLLSTYTGVSRRIGRSPLALDGRELQDAQQLAPDLMLDHWTAQDAARSLLMIARANADGADLSAVQACYEQGDAAEQQSWLRGVSLLPAPERFLPTVIDACRTNILPVFESIACENPYPARHFPERNFNQMVLKALFNGVAIARIVGLAARRNPELSRMSADYASERTAAGRSVPADISLAMIDVRATEEQAK